MNVAEMFHFDPAADLDAFISNMNAEMTDLGQAEVDPIDWDQFLNDPLSPTSPAMLVDTKVASVASPASVHSSESEQSRALDIKEGFDFDFSGMDGMDGLTDLPLPGIMHSVDDLPAYNNANSNMQMQGMLPFAPGSGLGDLGGLDGLDMVLPGMDVAALGLADFLAKHTPVDPAPMPVQSAPAQDFSDMYAKLGWSSEQTIQPAQLSLTPTVSATAPAPSMKRKGSDAGSDDSALAKRPRGRPPKARADSSTLSTPLVRTGSFESEFTSESPAAIVKRTASGKPSTARPKSVVPEKYFKDGTAQAITGMTMEQILAFPTFEELLKAVSPELRAGAADFGERIADNRDKAKDAAKKSREERKAKIESLETTVQGLEDKVKGMQGVLMGLVARGVLRVDEVKAFM